MIPRALSDAKASDDCAILCNGPTLAQVPLAGIPCDTIGLNRSWELHASTYHCMLDPEHWQAYERITGRPASSIARLIVGACAEAPASAQKVVLLDDALYGIFGSGGIPRWCDYVFEDWLKHSPRAYACGCVTYFALQIAVALGYSTIYLIGLDQRNEHDDRGKFYASSPTPAHVFARQRELFGYVQGLIDCDRIPAEIINVELYEDASACRAFPRTTFAEAFGA